jgi:hypothetical protein
MSDAHAGGQFSPAILRGPPSATASEQTLPVHPIVVMFDPVIDCLMRDVLSPLLGMLSFEASGDLVGRPPLPEPHADVCARVWVVHLPAARPLTPSHDGLLLGLARRVGAIRRCISGQFATNCAGTSPEAARNGPVGLTSKMSLRKDFSFFHGKMRVHRWDSVRARLPCSQLPHSNSQRCFPSTHTLHFKFDVTEYTAT